MALPTPVVRGQTNGQQLNNGHQSTIAFASNLTLDIMEKTLTPPAIDGGDPIDTTTMLTSTFMTKAPPCLQEWGDVVVTCGYDPAVLADLQALINVIMAITLEFPDNTTLTWWGHLRRVEPGQLARDVFPELTLTIVIDNWDPVNCVEAGPVLVNGSGSCNPCTYTTDLVA